MRDPDHTPLVGVMVGTDTAITEADDAFLDMLGYSRDELEAGQLDWKAMTPPEYLYLDEAGTRQAAAGGYTVPYRKEFIRKDGSRTPVLLVCATVDGHPKRWMGYVVDLSATTIPQAAPAQKPITRGPQDAFLARLVHELVRERSRTFAMLDSADATIWAVDLDYRLLSDNLAFRIAQAGNKHQLAIGDVVLADEFPDDIRAYWKQHYDRAFAGEQHTLRYDSPRPGRVAFDYTFSPIVESDGKVIGATIVGVDVSAEVRAAAALAAGEARFRSIFEQAGDVAFMTSPEFVITYVSVSLRDVFGHEPSVAIGERLWQVFGAWAVDSPSKALIDRLSAHGSRVRTNARIIDAAGEPRWVEVTIINLVDDPAVQGYVGHVRDITHEQAAVQLLDHRTSLLRLAGRLAKVGGWAIDSATRHVLLSDEVYTLLAIPPGTSPTLEASLAYYPPESGELLRHTFEQCFAHGTPFDVEVQATTQLGDSLRLQVIGEGQFDSTGQITGIQGALADVTERHRNVGTLRQQATLLQKATDAIIERDLDGRVTYWNHAAELLYGWTAEEAIGALLGDLIDAGAHQYVDEITHIVRQVGEWSGRREQTRRDGRSVWVEVHVTLVCDEQGEPTGMFSIGSDITQRLELEEQLALAQRLESIGQLTGGIAHDFNNLLTVIIGSSELLANEVAGDPRLAPLASMVLSAAERGSQLTSRLLSFARRQALQPKLVDPASIVDNMRDLLLRSLSEAIDVVIHHDPEVWPVRVDPGLLEAAIVNVSINARDAMPHGGTLLIHTSNSLLGMDQLATAPGTKPGEYVLIRVADDGEGMSPDVLARAFDPFFTTKDVGKGSGLGLSMVYGFVKQSGGHIEIRSEPGRGTRLDLYLPRSFGEPSTPVAEPDATTPGGDEIVLVVEDNGLVRAHASRLLGDLGYTVVEAADGPSALVILQSDRPIDLLFTDIVMPNGMTGVQLAEHAADVRPSLPVLLTSGYSDDATAIGATIGTSSQVLPKPYHRAELAVRIRAALDAPLRARGPQP